MSTASLLIAVKLKYNRVAQLLRNINAIPNFCFILEKEIIRINKHLIKLRARNE